MRGARARSARAKTWRPILAAALVLVATPPLASGQDGSLQHENARLQEENEQLRAELEAMRNEAAAASAEAATAADEAAGGRPAAGETETAGTSAEVVAEYVPMSRVTLTVSRDPEGDIPVVATPWYRTVPDTGLLPLREFVQLRATPAREGRPEQVWLSLNRQGVAAPLGSDTSAELQIDSWGSTAPVVDQKTARRRRLGRQSAVPQRKNETTVFALPHGALQKLAIAERASFDAGPVHFEFTDEHIAAASALTARLEKEEAEGQ